MSGTPTPPSGDDPEREISDHVNDYLESLRARFDELTDRIEEASRASIDRGRNELQDLIASGRVGAPPAVDTGPSADTGPPADAGPSANTGSSADAGPPADAGPSANTGSSADSGPDTEGEAGEPADAPSLGAAYSGDPQGADTQPDSPAEADDAFDIGGAVEPEWDPEFDSSPIAARLRSMHAKEAARAEADRALHPDDHTDDADDAAHTIGADAHATTHDSAPAAPTSDVGVATSDDAAPRRSAMPRPVTSGGDGTRRWGVATLVALVALAAAFLAGRWMSAGSGDDDATPTTLPSTPVTTAGAGQAADASIASAVESAIAALAPGTVTVTVDDGAVVLSGTVADASTRDALSSVTLAIAGVRDLDNQVQIEAGGPPPSAEAVQAAADEARINTGFEHLDVAVVEGVATITGVVSVESVADGVFASTAPLRDALAGINGIEEVVTRVQLRGDEAALRADLKELTDEAPIIFASNSAELDSAATASLDRAAEIITSYPGLRVLIAGHTDAAGGTAQNEALAAARGQAVLGYLLSRGVPITRLQVVSYGELFPGAGAEQSLNRRIEFEVAP